MTPLRENLERAKADYERLRYRGNLAADVLGTARDVTSTPARNPHRWMAIAAALALSAATFFAGRYSQQPDAPVEVAQQPTVIVPNVPPTNESNEATAPETAIASATDTEAANEQNFSVVPTSASFTNESVSVVPDLASLETATKTQSASTTFVPMSLMLLSADEYAAMQPASDTTSTPADNTSSSPLTPEERS